MELKQLTRFLEASTYHMPDRFYWNTVTPLLKSVLALLMKSEIFQPFRLVGGTSLSLQLGHRISDDIDLFTDADYGSIDFEAIDHFLRLSFAYVSKPSEGVVGIGRSYFIGNNIDNSVKLDIYYSTEKFMRPALAAGSHRFATTEEIVAMKIDIVQRKGRKKDFWDLHELLDSYSIETMIDLHEERYPYGHKKQTILTNFTDFSNADDDLDPKCLKGKIWELIKYDIFTRISPKPEPGTRSI